MKKLMLICAAFSMFAATAAIAQSNASDNSKQDNAQQVISQESAAKPEVVSEPASTPKSCCKAGASKSCCKDKSSAKKGSSKSCSHAHASDDADSKDKAAVDGTVQPAAVAPSDRETPKK